MVLSASSDAQHCGSWCCAGRHLGSPASSHAHSMLFRPLGWGGQLPKLTPMGSCLGEKKTGITNKLYWEMQK